MEGSLNNVSIIVTSFLRLGHLAECLWGLREVFPDAETIVVDDSGFVPETSKLYHGQGIFLPFDSGLTVKRNVGVKAATREYILLGCDDFDFDDLEARDGVVRLAQVLDQCPEVDVAVGRVDRRPYEGTLILKPGEYIREVRLEGALPYRLKPEPITSIDIGINYFLARRDILLAHPWDETIRPIGGEHADFFLTLKQEGVKVVWVPNVNINTLKLGRNAEDPRYAGFRRRAWATGHKIFLEKWGVKRYISFEEKP